MQDWVSSLLWQRDSLAQVSWLRFNIRAGTIFALWLQLLLGKDPGFWSDLCSFKLENSAPTWWWFNFYPRANTFTNDEAWIVLLDYLEGSLLIECEEFGTSVIHTRSSDSFDVWKHHALLKKSSSRSSIDALQHHTSEVCLLVYGWTLVAPKILSNRSFWTCEKEIRWETLWCGTWIFMDFSHVTRNISHEQHLLFVGLRSGNVEHAPSWIGRSSILYIDNVLHRKTAATCDKCAESPSVSYLKTSRMLEVVDMIQLLS